MCVANAENAFPDGEGRLCQQFCTSLHGFDPDRSARDTFSVFARTHAEWNATHCQNIAICQTECFFLVQLEWKMECSGTWWIHCHECGTKGQEKHQFGCHI